MQEYAEKIAQAAKYLLDKSGIRPEIAVVLGSGWGGLIGEVEGAVRIPYAEVPGMKASTVPGHTGEWVFGRVAGRQVAVMSGRLHYYEGYDLKTVTFPTRVIRAMGVRLLILTNAAGAVNTDFAPGDLMLMTDHLNMTGANPLIGPNDELLGPRFPDMGSAYDKGLLCIARKVSKALGFPVKEGVYAWMTGPSYETPAEIRMLRALGADAVGMSTVPEAIVASHAGMRTLGASCMTNMAAGVLDQPLTHKEVLETAERVKESYAKYLRALIAAIE
ncbi:MAG: purine-nucleoside phosphorylase [Clostridia bacterium]